MARSEADGAGTQTLPENTVRVPEPGGVSRRTRIAGLSIVLVVAVLPFLIASTMHVFGVSAQYSAAMQQYRHFNSLVTEITALALLAYVLHQNGQTLSGIGLTFRVRDILDGVLLIIGTSWLFQFLRLAVVRVYESRLGHPPAPPTLPLAGMSFSFLLVVFALVNPFFEELIVRAFLISEATVLTGSSALAVALSVSVQTSYHLYQGLPNAVGFGAVFLVFSLYYVRTRRAFPIIFAHLWSDMSYLVFHFRLGHF
jgi:membrane protease YdiL (CAAX protease family)